MRGIIKLALINWVVWIVLNATPYPYGLGDFWVALDWALHGQTFRGQSNLVFPFTYGLAIVAFVLAFALFWRKMRFSMPESFLLAGTFPFAQTMTFEIIYNYNGSLITPAKFLITNPFAFFFMNLIWFSWLVLGLTTIKFWKWGGGTTLMAIAVAIGWAIWDLIRFPQYFEGSIIGYLLNVSLKFLFFGFFASLLFTGVKSCEEVPRSFVGVRS